MSRTSPTRRSRILATRSYGSLDELSGPRRAWFEHVREVSAAGRFGTPDEVAEAAAFLLGRQAGFITGADLLMDGGVTAALRTGELTTP